ncbi:alpha-aspartyl dipeptidase-like [Paramacrobiotus metropolitanus]|uniref:alpha-aspartyl dipeptidase-like n=1 Tax=Paramacrobiotus metropolitanus TaxID=2943436 RepID=UPI0024460A49|nr:alpha-aspartyl dipeptidase-like [Paramacrobiotus metropolitanus]
MSQEKCVRRLLLLSSSCLHGCAPFEYAKEDITRFFGSGVKEILFIPYALKDHNDYLEKTRKRFADIGLPYNVFGIHEAASPVEAVKKASAIFIGGGNTFRLLKSLYDLNLIQPIRKRILEEGIPYMGSSAGTNVATVSINTTNDMPIVHPPSLEALTLVPFNINPHYIEPDPNTTHMGETRDERIFEYVDLDTSHPVLGLKEGSWLLVEGSKALVQGPNGGRLFIGKDQVKDIPTGSDVSYLMEGKTCS